MKSRNQPRGGARNETLEYMEEYDEEIKREQEGEEAPQEST